MNIKSAAAKQVFGIITGTALIGALVAGWPAVLSRRARKGQASGLSAVRRLAG